MVLLSFPADVLTDAQLLPTLGGDVLTEFASIAVEHIQVGSISRAKYTKAAAALKVNVQSLVTSIESLSFMMLECTRKNASGDDWIAGMEAMGFNDEQKTALKAAFDSAAKGLRSLLSDLSLRLPHYHNLEWRLDVQLGSRMMRSSLEPSLLLELETRDSRGQPSKQIMQMDYANLDHTVQELERAVKEANTKHARRVIRYVK